MREVEGKGEAGVVREGDNGGGAKSRLSGRWGRKPGPGCSGSKGLGASCPGLRRLCLIFAAEEHLNSSVLKVTGWRERPGPWAV